MEIYWNYATGNIEYEKSDRNCRIIKSPYDDEVITESWWIDDTHTQAINFAYTRKSPYGINRSRFFEANNVNPQELRWLMIPKSEYEQAIREGKMEQEEANG